MLKMKNILKRGVIVLIVLFLSINIVLAVGIKWFTEGESVQENSEKCINYGAYNPSDKDIKVKVEEIKKSLLETKTLAREIKDMELTPENIQKISGKIKMSLRSPRQFFEFSGTQIA